MTRTLPFRLAAKCAPFGENLERVTACGYHAVELYLTEEHLEDPVALAALCKRFPLEYALHSPNFAFSPAPLELLARETGANVVVFHPFLWDDEWAKLFEIFKGAKARICIENITSVHEPIRFVRRYNAGVCLDMEHAQMETVGSHEDVYRFALRHATHVHLTGYEPGSNKWHTPLHHSPEHTTRLLDIILESGYKGLVVNEADTRYQNTEELTDSAIFFAKWRAGKGL